MKYASQELDVEFNIKLRPWARSYNNALNGNGGIVGISITDERLKLFDYSDPIYYDKVILVVKKGNEFVFRKNRDLKGKVIGVCRGCSFGLDFEDAKKYFILVEDDSSPVRLRKVLAGVLDAAIISPGEYALNSIIQKTHDLSISQFTILDKPISMDSNHLAFAKDLKMEKFLKKFNQVIKKGNRTGVIDKIVARYTR